MGDIRADIALAKHVLHERPPLRHSKSHNTVTFEH